MEIDGCPSTSDTPKGKQILDERPVVLRQVRFRDTTPVGIKLLVGYLDDLTKQEEGTRSKELGRVKWIMSRKKYFRGSR